MRTHVITNAATGATETVAYSSEEEAAANLAAVPSVAEVEIERERRIALPFSVTASVGSFQINMDADSQRNIQGLATVGMYLIGQGSSQTTEFRDWQNQTRTLTPADLVAMGLQVAQRIQAVYAKSWALKAISPIPADYTDDGYWA